MRIFVTIITVTFSARWTWIKSMQWCCCVAGNVGERRSLTSFRGRTRFSLFLMLALSFNTSYDGIMMVLQF